MQRLTKIRILHTMLANNMGITKVTLKVTNPAYPKKFIKDEFLVDSGVAYTVLPQKYVKELNLKPSFKRSFLLADGRSVERQIGNAIVEFQGQEVASPVALGKKDDSLLLGTLTLEGLGFVLDPFSRKLYPAKLML